MIELIHLMTDLAIVYLISRKTGKDPIFYMGISLFAGPAVALLAVIAVLLHEHWSGDKEKQPSETEGCS